MRMHKSKKHKALKPTTTNKVPPIIDEVLNSPGQPLDTATRASMESLFSHDFGDVRVHTDSKAAESANLINALAYTQGSDIAFNAGEYKPGTMIGDTLVTHELAHVLQQDNSDSSIAAESGTIADDSRAEKDANPATLTTIMYYLGRTNNAFSQIKQNAAPIIRSGLRLQRCATSERIQAPVFFGRYSRETLVQINRRMESGAALRNWIAFGQVVASAENPISALHTAEAAEALSAVSPIIKAAVRQDIQLLILNHENELNDQERRFWNSLDEML